MAPKLSVLHKAFARKDLSVVALYMETCGGVPDHAAEMRNQVAKHRLDYPVLDAEAGPIKDPTRKRFRWAPHALVVDNKGRVLRTYGHMPRMRTLREDLDALVETGLFPDRPDDGWREFSPKAWVTVRTEGGGQPRNEKRTLKYVGRDGVTLQLDQKQEKLFREHLGHTDRDFKRSERKSESLTVDGRVVKARVFESTWKRLEMTFAERRWIADGAVVRREVLETCPDGSRVARTERLMKWADTLNVGERNIACRLVEKTVTWKSGRTDERVWTSKTVPGHLVKRIRKSVSNGETSTETTTVTAFGLR
ncbi:MAG: TlpA family protein disulfide reductase [Planctomycetota bacterium]